MSTYKLFNTASLSDWYGDNNMACSDDTHIEIKVNAPETIHISLINYKSKDLFEEKRRHENIGVKHRTWTGTCETKDRMLPAKTRSCFRKLPSNLSLHKQHLVSCTWLSPELYYLYSSLAPLMSFMFIHLNTPTQPRCFKMRLLATNHCKTWMGSKKLYPVVLNIAAKNYCCFHTTHEAPSVTKLVFY